MLLLVWALVCLTTVVYFRNRVSLIAGLAVVVYLAIPSVGRGLIVGTVVPLHPATVFVVVAALWFLFSQLRRIATTVLSFPGINLALGLLIAHSVMLTFVGTGTIGLLMNNLIGPYLLFNIVIHALRVEGYSGARLLVRILVFTAVCQAVLGLVQVVIGRPLVYEAQYTKFYWFNIDRFSRGLGTLDSALDLALLLVVAIPFVSSIHSSVARVALVSVLLGGVFATQSRLGVALAIIGVLYVAMSGKSHKSRIATSAGIVLCGLALLMSRFGQGFLGRAQNANGSTMRRTEATEYIFENALDKVLIGGGLNSSFGLRSGGTLGSSLENGFAMYAYDFGWLASAGFILVLSVLLVRLFLRKIWGGVVSIAVLVTMLAGYSSFMTQSASGAIMFFVCGILVSYPLALSPATAHSPSELSLATERPRTSNSLMF